MQEVSLISVMTLESTAVLSMVFIHNYNQIVTILHHLLYLQHAIERVLHVRQTHVLSLSNPFKYFKLLRDLNCQQEKE